MQHNRFFFNFEQARSPSALSNRSGGYAMQAPEPDVQTIRLHKSNNGMGLSIVAAKVSYRVYDLK